MQRDTRSLALPCRVRSSRRVARDVLIRKVKYFVHAQDTDPSYAVRRHESSNLFILIQEFHTTRYSRYMFSYLMTERECGFSHVLLLMAHDVFDFELRDGLLVVRAHEK